MQKCLNKRSLNDRCDVFSRSQRFEGAYAIAAVYESEPLVIARNKGPPLVVGMGHDENFIASDQLALADFAENFVFLEEGDLAEITSSGTKFWNLNDEEVEITCRYVAKSLRNC